MAGFIVIDRKIEDWRWIQFPHAVALWVHILLMANWKDGWFYGELIPRGSFATSIQSLANKTGMEVHTVRKWLKRFEEDGQIEVKSTNRFTVIKVLNYSAFQDIQTEGYSKQNSKPDSKLDGNQSSKRDSELDSNDRTKETIGTKVTNKPSNQDIYTAASKLVMDYLNRKTGKAYKYVESNMKHIRARLKEGYKMADFEKVIDSKYAQWHNDQKMSKFLRPETLFGTKFDSYLNEASTSAPDFTNPDYYTGDDW